MSANVEQRTRQLLMLTANPLEYAAEIRDLLGTYRTTHDLHHLAIETAAAIAGKCMSLGTRQLEATCIDLLQTWAVVCRRDQQAADTTAGPFTRPLDALLSGEQGTAGSSGQRPTPDAPHAA